MSIIDGRRAMGPIVDGRRLGALVPDVDPLAALSDDFLSGPTALVDRGWLIEDPRQNLASHLVDVGTGFDFELGLLGGGGFYPPAPSNNAGGPGQALRFNADTSPIVYKEIEGPCRMEARIRVFGFDGTGLPPVTGFRIAAIVADDPDRSSINTAHTGIGATNTATLTGEYKHTIGSDSGPNGGTLPGYGAGGSVIVSGYADVALELSSSGVWTHQVREVGAPMWMTIHEVNRGDVGATMPALRRWGVTTYAGPVAQGILGRFESVSFSTPA